VIKSRAHITATSSLFIIPEDTDAFLREALVNIVAISISVAIFPHSFLFHIGSSAFHWSILFWKILAYQARVCADVMLSALSTIIVISLSVAISHGRSSFHNLYSRAFIKAFAFRFHLSSLSIAISFVSIIIY